MPLRNCSLAPYFFGPSPLCICTVRFCTDIPFERIVEYWPDPYVEMRYKVRLHRRPLYYVIYMILPTTVISFMSLLAFLLPSDSGEKIGLGLCCQSLVHSLAQWSAIYHSRGFYTGWIYDQNMVTILSTDGRTDERTDTRMQGGIVFLPTLTLGIALDRQIYSK